MGWGGAIAETADRVYGRLPEVEQAIARTIFLRLTELGEGTEDTRRRVQVGELVLSGETAVRVRAVLTRLADARLVMVDAETAEMSHEALIREWPRLRGWLDENREGLRLHRQVTKDAGVWEKNDRETSYLYRGTRLAQVQEWMGENGGQLSELEQDFLRNND